MSDLSSVPLKELENDLAAAKMNVVVIKKLEAGGATRIYGQSPQTIIANDEAVIEIIEEELKRREGTADD